MTPARVVVGLSVAVCVLAGSPRAASAQALNYGVTGGIGLSRVVFSGGFAEDTSTSPGSVAGGFAGRRVVGRLSIRAEGLFVTERATIADTVEDRFQFLDVPLLVRYDAMSVIGHRVEASGGFVFRRRLDATETVAGESFSISDGVAASGSALAVGADVHLRGRLSAGVRYLHGRSGIYKRIGGGTAGRDRVIQVTVEWRLR